MFRIQNIRLGFATNSSSSHTTIVVTKPKKVVHGDVIAEAIKFAATYDPCCPSFTEYTVGGKLMFALICLVGMDSVDYWNRYEPQPNFGCDKAMEEYSRLFPEFDEQVFHLAVSKVKPYGRDDCSIWYEPDFSEVERLRDPDSVLTVYTEDD